MILKLRDNIFIGDKTALSEIGKENKEKITSIINVAEELDLKAKEVDGYRYVKIGLSLTKPNPSYIKDLAAHAGKYQMQFGDIMLIIGMTGLRRAAFVACRIVCELEDKGIYEILQEVKELQKDFKMGEAYL